MLACCLSHDRCVSMQAYISYTVSCTHPDD